MSTRKKPRRRRALNTIVTTNFSLLPIEVLSHLFEYCDDETLGKSVNLIQKRIYQFFQQPLEILSREKIAEAAKQVATFEAETSGTSDSKRQQQLEQLLMKHYAVHANLFWKDRRLKETPSLKLIKEDHWYSYQHLCVHRFTPSTYFWNRPTFKEHEEVIQFLKDTCKVTTNSKDTPKKLKLEHPFHSERAFIIQLVSPLNGRKATVTVTCGMRGYIYGFMDSRKVDDSWIHYHMALQSFTGKVLSSNKWNDEKKMTMRLVQHLGIDTLSHGDEISKRQLVYRVLYDIIEFIWQLGWKSEFSEDVHSFDRSGLGAPEIWYSAEESYNREQGLGPFYEDDKNIQQFTPKEGYIPWEKLDPETRAHYEQKALADKRRYDEELERFSFSDDEEEEGEEEVADEETNPQEAANNQEQDEEEEDDSSSEE